MFPACCQEIRFKLQHVVASVADKWQAGFWPITGFAVIPRIAFSLSNHCQANNTTHNHPPPTTHWLKSNGRTFDFQLFLRLALICLASWRARVNYIISTVLHDMISTLPRLGKYGEIVKSCRRQTT